MEIPKDTPRLAAKAARRKGSATTLVISLTTVKKPNAQDEKAAPLAIATAASRLTINNR